MILPLHILPNKKLITTLIGNYLLSYLIPTITTIILLTLPHVSPLTTSSFGHFPSFYSKNSRRFERLHGPLLSLHPSPHLVPSTEAPHLDARLRLCDSATSQPNDTASHRQPATKPPSGCPRSRHHTVQVAASVHDIDISRALRRLQRIHTAVVRAPFAPSTESNGLFCRTVGRHVSSTGQHRCRAPNPTTCSEEPPDPPPVHVVVIQRRAN